MLNKAHKSEHTLTVMRCTRFLASAAACCALPRFNAALIFSMDAICFRDGVDLGALEGMGRARLPGVKKEGRACPRTPGVRGALPDGVAAGAKLAAPIGMAGPRLRGGAGEPAMSGSAVATAGAPESPPAVADGTCAARGASDGAGDKGVGTGTAGAGSGGADDGGVSVSAAESPAPLSDAVALS